MKSKEVEMIERIGTRVSISHPRVKVGIGDDVAVLKPGRRSILLTTDTLVERVHFDFKFSTPEQVGYKAVAVNVSDVVAKAGTPLAALVSLSLSKRVSNSAIDRLYVGIGRACREYGCVVVGGNLSRTSGPLTITLTLFGEADRVVLRSGARVGDWVAVSGTLGDSAGGLFHLRRKKRGQFPRCVTRHRTPKVRAELGRRLMRCRDVTAAMDLSDSLANALYQLGNASKVGFEIDADKIPLSKELTRLASTYRKQPLEFALFGGEDYELLMTASHLESLPPGVTVIGRVVSRVRGILLSRDGQSLRLPNSGWDHFS